MTGIREITDIQEMDHCAKDDPSGVFQFLHCFHHGPLGASIIRDVNNFAI